jgi:uncharacterized protein (TIGR00255 family)
VLLSMTGFGSARGVGPGFAVVVEVRAVNNRHLKLSVRGTDPYPLFESELEKVVRRHVRRGSVQVQVRVDREARAADLTLNTAALQAYKRQVIEACDGLDSTAVNAVLSGLLALPGIAPEGGDGIVGGLPEDEWPVVEKVLDAALTACDGVRRDEGRAMAVELMALHAAMSDALAGVRECLPAVVANYRTRILDRVRQAVADAGVTLEADQLIREVAVFADRTDVSEEVTRFAAHLDQFAELVKSGAADGAGRRLEFVVQEMGREANTMGSKAGDVGVSRRVVDLKANLERVRELIQNVE